MNKKKAHTQMDKILCQIDKETETGTETEKNKWKNWERKKQKKRHKKIYIERGIETLENAIEISCSQRDEKLI